MNKKKAEITVYTLRFSDVKGFLKKIEEIKEDTDNYDARIVDMSYDVENLLTLDRSDLAEFQTSNQIGVLTLYTEKNVQ